MNFVKCFAPLVLTAIILCSNVCSGDELLNYKSKAFSLKGHTTPNNQLILETVFSSPVEINHFELQDPPRIVIDYSHIVIPKPIQLSVEDNSWINGIRIGRHPDKTRFVIDLIEQYPTVKYSLVQNGPSVLISLSRNLSTTMPVEVSPETTLKKELVDEALQPKTDIQEKSSQSPTPKETAYTQTTAPHLIKANKVKQGLTTDPEITQRRITLFEPNSEESYESDLNSKSSQKNPSESPASIKPKTITVAEDTLSSYTDLKIAVDRVMIKFYADKPPVNNLIVKNLTDEKLFIFTYVTHADNPSSPQSQRTVSTNLLVSPRKFSIEPQNQKTIRLVAKQTNVDHEEVYYVSFLPDKKHFEDSHLRFDVYGRKGDLTVVSGIETQVLFMPKEFRTNLHWERNQDTLEFVNDSNSSILLTQGKSCLPDGTCIPLNNKRIYIGQKWKIRVPEKSAVSFVKEIGNQFENLLIPAK